jgi:hypothetical protein
MVGGEVTGRTCLVFPMRVMNPSFLYLPKDRKNRDYDMRCSFMKNERSVTCGRLPTRLHEESGIDGKED